MHRAAYTSLPRIHPIASRSCNIAVQSFPRGFIVGGTVKSSISRRFASAVAQQTNDITKLRNIGISAHIDSGKTTLTERILFYTGRISEIHEVRGKDEKGAKMDSMDLEREKGITIQSAATHCHWGGHQINIIDTPGHVDFTIEVERALRVLDGAVLVMCGVSGVQSQTITVDRQMRRYNIPRLTFINKLDRSGADPMAIIDQLRAKLNLNAAAVQIPIGVESQHEGVIDIINEIAMYFRGYKGLKVDHQPIPDRFLEEVKEKRIELIEKVANVDEKLGEWMIENDFPNTMPPVKELKEAIRRATLARTFVPVFMGSAYTNIGVQALLDGVADYLPNPLEIDNEALDLNNEEAKIQLKTDPKAPLVGLAFKLQESKFGQLTYMRVYQGTIKKGDSIRNTSTGKVNKVPRLVKMHSSDMEDISEATSGEICAMFGVDCYSGNTFVTGSIKYAMQSMHVPEPVMSLAVTPKNKNMSASFSKALNMFQKEDPTFRQINDAETNQTIIAGMGELHLFIYLERMKREFGVECDASKPLVNYRETIEGTTKFDYTHKKQSGGAGQYARVAGMLEAVPHTDPEPRQFVDDTTGGSIPPHFMEACRKGFLEGCDKGPLTGSPIVGVRMIVNDGAAHSVDSSDLAFKICTGAALREALKRANPVILEPLMTIEVQIPLEFQGAIISQIAQRKGIIVDTTATTEFVTITCEVPLNDMFGYSTDLRSATQGKGEFSMEYKTHQPVDRSRHESLISDYLKRKAKEDKEK